MMARSEDGRLGEKRRSLGKKFLNILECSVCNGRTYVGEAYTEGRKRSSHFGPASGLLAGFASRFATGERLSNERLANEYRRRFMKCRYQLRNSHVLDTEEHPQPDSGIPVLGVVWVEMKLIPLSTHLIENLEQPVKNTRGNYSSSDPPVVPISALNF
ncbi:hypothetical protein Tco_1318931 [Tanacetum coccineum]